MRRQKRKQKKNWKKNVYDFIIDDFSTNLYTKTELDSYNIRDM